MMAVHHLLLRNSLTEATFFWQRYPGLLFGLTMLLSTFAVLSTPLALIPLLLILLTVPLPQRAIQIALLGATLALTPHLHPANVRGKGIFTIHSIIKGRRGGWNYRGSFTSAELQLKNLPCTIYAKKRYRATHAYEIEGNLKIGKRRMAQLKTKTPWQKAQRKRSLVEWRLSAKEHVKAYLQQKLPSPQAALFLGGLVTGDLGDRVLQFQFSKLGLAHLLAISGFHFALLAHALHFALRLFLPPKAGAATLLVALLLYFLFVGNAPSVQRAWITASLFLLGQLFEKRTFGLNSLGLAICVSVLLNPFSVLSLGFQLSFLATWGILQLTGPVDSVLRKWIPRRDFAQMKDEGLLEQHFYIAATFFRQALSLTLAVHLALLPVLLFHFHAFQLHSIVYNLFFPFLVSLSMLLLLLGLALPFVGGSIHQLNSIYTEGILRIVETPPIPLKTLYVETISPWFVLAYLVVLFLVCSSRRNRDLPLV